MDSSDNQGTPQDQSSEMENDAAAEAPAAPPFHNRLIDLFFSPGKLAEALAAKPVWAAALLLSAALISLAMALIPPEIFAEMQRQAILETGREVPPMPDSMVRIMRWVTPIFAGLSVLIFTFVFAGLYTLIFAFLMGDEGKYRQYLAITAHAWIIPAVAGLLITPLRISSENPQLTFNLASFMFFLEDGYLLNVFKAIDLTQIWAMVVIAIGAHAIDNRRSVGSAATILIGIMLLMALVFARFMP